MGIIVAEVNGSSTNDDYEIKDDYDFKESMRHFWESKSIEPSFAQCRTRDLKEAAVINILYGIANPNQLVSIVRISSENKQRDFKLLSQLLWQIMYGPY
eukprot:gene19563-23436_t